MLRGVIFFSIISSNKLFISVYFSGYKFSIFRSFENLNIPKYSKYSLRNVTYISFPIFSSDNLSIFPQESQTLLISPNSIQYFNQLSTLFTTLTISIPLFLTNFSPISFSHRQHLLHPPLLLSNSKRFNV